MLPNIEYQAHVQELVDTIMRGRSTTERHRRQ